MFCLSRHFGNRVQSSYIFLYLYLLQLAKTIQPKGPYHLVGYSFGAVVAIEMARQLIAENTLGSITLLDGAPQRLRVEIGTHYEDSLSKTERSARLLVAFSNIIARVEAHLLKQVRHYL